MNEFDIKAVEWDSNPVHHEISAAIAERLTGITQSMPGAKALEYGSGTGILSLLMADRFSEIVLMDNSHEMIKVLRDKLARARLKHLRPLIFNLMENDYHDDNFDIIYTQMVLHHVSDTQLLFRKFYNILNNKGFLAIADLYTEDGSFHGENFTGHKGFDADELKKDLETTGFANINVAHCYTIKKSIDNSIKEFPVFLITAQK